MFERKAFDTLGVDDAGPLTELHGRSRSLSSEDLDRAVRFARQYQLISKGLWRIFVHNDIKVQMSWSGGWRPLRTFLKSPKTSSLRHRHPILFPTVRQLGRYLDDIDNGALRCQWRPENATCFRRWDKGSNTTNEKWAVHLPEKFRKKPSSSLSELVAFKARYFRGVVIFAELHRRSASQEGLHLAIPCARQSQLINYLGNMEDLSLEALIQAFRRFVTIRESFWTFERL